MMLNKIYSIIKETRNEGIWGSYVARKKVLLEHDLSNPPPTHEVIIYTLDHIEIGRLPYDRYIKSKYEADTDIYAKLRTLFGLLSVAYYMFLPLLKIIAFVLLIIGVSSWSTGISAPPIEESDITSLIKIYITFLVFWSFLALAGIFKFPSYRNYTALRLQQLLALELPNIANTRGFYVDESRLYAKSMGKNPLPSSISQKKGSE